MYQLDRFLTTRNESTTSYVINRSVGGEPIDQFIGEVYEFESWPPSRWPNIILIETALNSDFSWDTSLKIDNLIFLLQEKWRAQNLSRPDILFLELFSVGWIANKFEGSELQQKRVAHLNSFNAVDGLSEKFNRGCRGSPYINAVARCFYSYPMLSAADTLFPSFVRFFVKNPLDYSYGDVGHDNRTIWPYTHDGVHLSCKGHLFVGSEILIPFFRTQMKKKSHGGGHHRSTHREPISVEEHGIRLFSPSLYVKVVVKWISYDSTSREGMWNPIKESTGWNMTFVDNGHHHRGDGHDCYGARGLVRGKATFQFKAPSFCTSCKVGLAYIHSWNESFVGDVECKLMKKTETGDSMKALGSNDDTIYLKGSRYNSASVVGIVPRETLFPAALDGGEYVIECAKQDDRFSCFTALTVYNYPNQR